MNQEAVATQVSVGIASKMAFRSVVVTTLLPMKNLGVWLWIIVAVAGVVLGLPGVAQATTNVVPNPGFEQGGCGDTPVICGWQGDENMYQDTTNPHSGSASMAVNCGTAGCPTLIWDDGDYGAWTGAATVCLTVGPGSFPASFWYRTGDSAAIVGMAMHAFQGANCTGADQTTAGWVAALAIGDNAWHQVTGNFVAPSGTVSAFFSINAVEFCGDICFPEAHFDDLDVEDAAASDATPPETTITSGPSGTTSSTSATFEFAANEPATFECSLDTAPLAACSSPASYTALAEGSHTFRVRSTDTVGNIDPAPAERGWTVQANTPPVARFTFSCSTLTCSFDGSSSADSDGSIAGYAWNFGDGAGGCGVTASHTYGLASNYTVMLTVTDDRGATASDSKAVNPISLSASGYKLNGLQKADLSWTGASGTSFDVYRNGVRIATVQTTSYRDNINKRGPGIYTYKVCAVASALCSNEVTVTF